VDHVPALLSLLDHLVHLITDPPSPYLDIYGVKLGRHGSISIISINLVPTKKVYLLDVNVLGNAAFSTANSKGRKGLKGLPEGLSAHRSWYSNTFKVGKCA
jgi:exonuclease 3'-5' domain-containing protein 1